MLDNENIDGVDDDEDEHSEELNILEQLSKLELDDDTYDPAHALSEQPVGLAEASRGILNPSHPVFSIERQSSKVLLSFAAKKNFFVTSRLISDESCFASFTRKSADGGR